MARVTQPRELHIEESLACIDFDRGPVDPVIPQPSQTPFCEELVSSEFFTLHRHTLHGQTSFSADDRFHVLLVLGGEGVLSCEQVEHRLTVGTTLLIPASCSASRIVAFDELTLLDAFVPSVVAAPQPASRAVRATGRFITPSTFGS